LKIFKLKNFLKIFKYLKPAAGADFFCRFFPKNQRFYSSQDIFCKTDCFGNLRRSFFSLYFLAFFLIFFSPTFRVSSQESFICGMVFGLDEPTGPDSK